MKIGDKKNRTTHYNYILRVVLDADKIEYSMISVGSQSVQLHVLLIRGLLSSYTSFSIFPNTVPTIQVTKKNFLSS